MYIPYIGFGLSPNPKVRYRVGIPGHGSLAGIDEFDKDQDGEINEDEFISIMANNDDL